jgi:hypothetical protein
VDGAGVPAGVRDELVMVYGKMLKLGAVSRLIGFHPLVPVFRKVELGPVRIMAIDLALPEMFSVIIGEEDVPSHRN